MLTRLECLEIMELGAQANLNEIETRYMLLIKRYHGRTDPEAAAELDKITMAYNILTGRYIEPEPVNPRLEKVVFGKSLKQWLNFWHYARLPLFLAAVGLTFLIYFIITIATNKAPDFQIYATGLFVTSDDADARVKQYVMDVVQDAKDIEFQVLPIDMRKSGISGTTTAGTTESGSGTTTTTSGGFIGDIDNQYAYIMKLTAMFAAESIEIYLCDEPLYTQYAPQGVYAELDDLYARLQDLPADILAKIKPLRRYPADSENMNLEATPTPMNTDEANKDTALPITGLDVTELHLTEGLGIYGNSEVLTVGVRATDSAKAKLFLERWIRDYEKMHAMQKAFEDSLKASLTPAASDTTAGSSAD
jgi:hypothetical protein